ncbi:hypothetical protein [Tunicatimonas pelagia]|uniref:hypothetical protein n=1 Tax=Tunicatimonas pelagia TaxID=931531 RepID=UPI00266539D4|nr:hypothetical protein [Tunicatimonas pelagia]WKN44978.1 hypothetical protein P0M28_08375 [Tunicatimonas pelagia]
MKASIILFYLYGMIVYGTHAQTDDPYGGYPLGKSEATGFFRIEKMKNRSFFITPTGHPFLALGINHFHTLDNPDYDAVVDNIQAWGFTAGCYQGPEWMWQRFPYSKGINLLEIRSYKSDDDFAFQDVFDPAYLQALEKKIATIVQPQASNKNLLGYFLTDMPVWTNKRAGGWIAFFKNLDQTAPGYAVWQRWKAENPDLPEEAFLGIIARQLYQMGTDYIRKYDCNHLIFSDRYNEEDVSDYVIQEVLPYVDAIATQPAGEFHLEYFEHLSSFGKPIYIADHVTSFSTEEHPVTMGQVANSQDQYLEHYTQYLEKAFAQPYIIGYNKCQYVNEPRETLLKQGLVNEEGVPYSYVHKLNEIHTSVLQKAYQTHHK